MHLLLTYWIALMDVKLQLRRRPSGNKQSTRECPYLPHDSLWLIWPVCCRHDIDHQPSEHGGRLKPQYRRGVYCFHWHTTGEHERKFTPLIAHGSSSRYIFKK